MRRTKEEAEQTRRSIMGAALRTFDEHGISRTTMEHIAKTAGVTRGAVYWHFADKQALLRAIRDEVSLPLVDRADFTLLHDSARDPLERVQRFLLDIMTVIDRDPQTRVACSVMSFKCEYVDELEEELAEFARKVEHSRKSLVQVYSQARAQKKLRAGFTPEMAALETTIFLVGLIRVSLLDGHGISVRKHVRALIAAHVAGRRALKAH